MRISALTDRSGLAGCTMSRTTMDAAALTVEPNDDMNAANSAAINDPRNPAGIICTITTGRIFSGSALATRPEEILPVVIVQMIPAGLRGSLIAALLAAFMSSFSSTVNAAASMVVRDLVQPAKPDLSVKALIRVSYIATVSTVV